LRMALPWPPCATRPSAESLAAACPRAAGDLGPMAGVASSSCRRVVSSWLARFGRTWTAQSVRWPSPGLILAGSAGRASPEKVTARSRPVAARAARPSGRPRVAART
jgi:hypothetical protein